MNCFCGMCEFHRSAEKMIRERGEKVPEAIDTKAVASRESVVVPTKEIESMQADLLAASRDESNTPQSMYDAAYRAELRLSRWLSEEQP